jgi:tetratricopeptide (TPR) repeat protein
MEDEEDELNQHEAEQLNAEGNQLMQKKHFQEALELYSAALQLSPTGPNSHVYFSNRSAAYLSLNDHANSIRDSERSLALCPEYAKAHSRLGLAYFVSGQYAEAVKAYEVALEYEPENEWNRSHYEKALKKLAKSQRKSVQERPFDEETVHTNNTHHEEDQQHEFTKTHEADQHKDEGNAHMSNKEYEMALQQYTKAISISPAGQNSHVYYSNRAAAYCYLGQYDAAADDCMASIEINPRYEKAHARLGLSRFFLEDFQGAIEAYERALELDPTNAASMSYLGKAKQRLEEKIEAERERRSKDFMQQQEELQRAMEEQLMLQGQGSDGDGDSWA